MATKKAFVSGHNYIQDIHMEPGIYTVLMKVKSMYGDVCSFALFDGTAWTHYDMDTVQGQWKWAYVTFRILEPMTKINLISRNYSAELPVYVVEPQIVAGNVPFDAGVSPADLSKESKELQSILQSMEYLKLAIGQDAEINGALFTLVTILLKQNMNADVTAGISGIQRSDLNDPDSPKDAPAIWAGGTYAQAIGGTAKAIIRHDGSSKFEETKVSGSIIAKQGSSGIQTWLDSSGIRVFNDTGQMNIRFGMKNGYAVLEYYDNDGTFLYDLGPNGIKELSVREEKWTVFKRIFLGTDMSTILNEAYRYKYKKSWNELEVTYYTYTSKIVAGINQDPTNDGAIFTSMNKTGDRMPLGFYCRKMPLNMNLIYKDATGTNQIINSQLPYLQTGNENVYDRNNICFIDLEYYVNGKRSQTNYYAYWNETPEGYPEI